MFPGFATNMESKWQSKRQAHNKKESSSEQRIMGLGKSYIPQWNAQMNILLTMFKTGFTAHIRFVRWVFGTCQLHDEKIIIWYDWSLRTLFWMDKVFLFCWQGHRLRGWFDSFEINSFVNQFWFIWRYIHVYIYIFIYLYVYICVCLLYVATGTPSSHIGPMRWAEDSCEAPFNGAPLNGHRWQPLALGHDGISGASWNGWKRMIWIDERGSNIYMYMYIHYIYIHYIYIYIIYIYTCIYILYYILLYIYICTIYILYYYIYMHYIYTCIYTFYLFTFLFIMFFWIYSFSI